MSYRIVISQEGFPPYIQVSGLTAYFDSLGEAERAVRRTFKHTRRSEFAGWSLDPGDVSRFRCSDARGRYTVIMKDCGT